MIYLLRRRAHFSSAHRLTAVAEGHPCGQLHGHTWEVEIELRVSVLPEEGWVMDFKDVDAALHPLVQQLDHKVLNDIPGLQNPTSEHIAMWFMQALRQALPNLCAVRVRESARSEVEVRLPEPIP